ncbi:MAG TPA: helix-turn-helix domain-containing protein [Flavipsychrobacter sp.]|nr:helix-turn-helix domain-containing protein [Flavipsychrobacter sp.]
MSDAREHILLVSLKLFLQKSFKEVTMKEIVEQTGLSKGAFYHYFSSKEQVFEEVIKFFFTAFIVEDYDSLPHDSLYVFYSEMLKEIERKSKRAIVRLGGGTEFSANYYFILFDAIKMLPAFKEELYQHQKEELRAWTKMVQIARNSGEIASEMTNEQIAELFIYISDGVGINLIMEEKLDRLKKKLSTLWDGLYTMLKTK